MNDGGQEVRRDLVVCQICQINLPYDFYGKKAPYCPGVIYFDDTYLLRDPYSPEPRVVAVAGPCDLCSSIACLDCSVFYTKRFCGKCILENSDGFPSQIVVGIKDKLQQVMRHQAET
ncbi:hypothetical protein ACHWQZ_G007138 [Mnemiopsis leidyi]